MAKMGTQEAKAVELLKRQGMGRLVEFRRVGIAAATLSRMTEKGIVIQLARGLYQLADAPLDEHHSLAEAAKLVPRGIICLSSALAFHELTDVVPSRIWMAIGARDRRPSIDHPPMQFVRFGEKVFGHGMEEHLIERTKVRIYNPAKTVIDLFRYRKSAGRRYQKSPGLTIALEGLREALRQRKATPAQLAAFAEQAGVWTAFQPYLEAMTANA